MVLSGSLSELLSGVDRLTVFQPQGYSCRLGNSFSTSAHCDSWSGLLQIDSLPAVLSYSGGIGGFSGMGLVSSRTFISGAGVAKICDSWRELFLFCDSHKQRAACGAGIFSR